MMEMQVTYTSKIKFVMFLALVLATGVLGVRSSSAQTSANTGLFVATTAPAVLGAADNDGVIRSRTVSIDFTRFQNAQIGAKIPLNLFDDSLLTAQLERRENGLNGAYTWAGAILEQTDASFVLTVNGNQLLGQVMLLGQTYLVEPQGTNGLHTVSQVDPERLIDRSFDDGVLVPKPANSLLATESISTSTADDGDLIDVLVVYSDDLTAAGVSTTTLQTYVNNYVAYTNQAYVNSQVTQRIQVVGLEEVAYDEVIASPDTTYESTALTRIKNLVDGYVDNVITLRNQYHADLVLMLLNNSGTAVTTSCAGVAYLQAANPPSVNSFEGLGYATMEACSFGAPVFAHELGHNMGGRHDWYMDSNTTPYTYAHGYVDTTNKFYTIMAYPNHCNAASLTCTLIPYFSNPAVTYKSAPTGVASGTNTTCTTGNVANPACDADIHRTFNENTSPNHITDSLRTSEIRWTGAISTDWFTAGNWVIAEGKPGSTVNTNRVPRAFDDVLIPTSPSGGRFPVIAAGSATAREVTIETGATLTQNGGLLTVSGDWQEQGTGRLIATAGTVRFTSNFAQYISTSSGSQFFDVEIGDDASAQVVTPLTALDVNGNFTVQNGAFFAPGAQTVKVAGNWLVDANGFVPGTATVMLDGATQTLDKTSTSQVVFSQNFSSLASGSYGSTMPTLWFRANAGNGTGAFNGQWTVGGAAGEALRWTGSGATSIDAWLFAAPVYLSPNTNYTLTFNYSVTSSADPSNYEVYLGDAPDIVKMSTMLWSQANVTATSSQLATVNFTVGTAGNYVLGFRNRDTAPGTGYALLDNINLNSTQGLTFYNLTVQSSGSATPLKDVSILNNLLTQAQGVYDVGTVVTTVEGAVTNNGFLSQTKNVTVGGSDATFIYLNLKNAAGSVDQYVGAEITTSPGYTTGDLGNTTVKIAGNRTVCSDKPSDPLIGRCFEITPTTSRTTRVKFWFLESERNGIDANTIVLWHNTARAPAVPAWTMEATGIWRSEGGITCGVDNICGVEVQLSSYSPFAPGSSSATPTAVELSNMQTLTGQPLLALLALTLAGLFGLCAWGYTRLYR
jgi:hypothetical protein